MVNRFHQVSLRHVVNEHHHEFLVLRYALQIQDKRMTNSLHQFDLVQDMLLLFILDQIVFALNFHSSCDLTDFRLPLFDKDWCSFA
jgi:hypothetical protein